MTEENTQEETEEETGTITWEKPSGLIIKTNSTKATIKHCKSLDWKKIEGDVTGTFKDSEIPLGALDSIKAAGESIAKKHKLKLK